MKTTESMAKVIVLVCMTYWYVCQKRKDTMEYREFQRGRGVWSSVGDTQTHVSCTTVLPKARTATDHSSPTVRMIHLGESNLFIERCPCLSDLWSFSCLPLPSTPTPKYTTSRSWEGNRIQGRPALGEKTECVGGLTGTWDKASWLGKHWMDPSSRFLLGFSESAQDQRSTLHLLSSSIPGHREKVNFTTKKSRGGGWWWGKKGNGFGTSGDME